MEPDIQHLAEEFDRAAKRAEQLLAGLSDEQVNWQPQGGKAWSLVQVLEHVALTHDAYIGPVAAALAAADARGDRERRGPIRLPWFGRWFVGQLEPPIKRRLPAVAKSLPPSEISKIEGLSHFRAAQANVRGFLLQYAHLDLNRIRFPNPFVPGIRFTCGTAFHILDAHNRRHLEQAQRVLADPDFPR